MKGDKKVIEFLNEILANELTAINQYFLHARILKDWGYNRIAEKVYHESIDEMKHAQTLIDRILFLEGLPNLQKLHPLRIGQNIKEILEADLELEMHAIPKLKDAIAHCVTTSDHVTRELIEKILNSEEGHVDWIESQMKIISDVGVENYLSEQIHPS